MKNDVGGYEYNAAVTLLKQIKCVLEYKMLEESADGMVGIVSKSLNTLTEYKSNVTIKKSHVKKQSISESAAASTTDWVVALETTTNADTKEESDRQNTSCLAAIGVKKAIAA